MILALALIYFVTFAMPGNLESVYWMSLPILLLLGALCLSVVSLLKNRNKVLPVLALLASVMPLGGLLCCGITGLAGFQLWDRFSGNNPAYAPQTGPGMEPGPGGSGRPGCQPH